MADDKPIIVIKKKGGHGGHHGGAWKIAYADFVTAMMCFFMVMWLVNSSSAAAKVSIASYFRKPGIFNEGSGTPLLLGGSGILSDAFIPPRPEDKRKIKDPTDDPAQKPRGETDRDLDKHYIQEGRQEPQRDKGPDTITGLNTDKKEAKDIKREIKLKLIAEKAKSQMQKMMAANPEMAKLLGMLDMKVESDGLKIEIMDTDKVSMFDSGSARIRKEAEGAFAKVTQILKQYPNSLEVSGHTDSVPFPSRAGSYTNWELSADRANAARRLIESQGFPARQVTSVVGKSSTEPKVPENPTAPQNRRITLKLKFDVDKLEETPAPDPSLKALENLVGMPTPNGTPAPQALVPQDGTPIPTPTPTPTATPTAAPTETPKRTLARSGSDRIKLPDGTPLAENPGFMPEDKIFGDNPVIGPRELFSGR
jgi:chemotaxis protein MotB